MVFVFSNGNTHETFLPLLGTVPMTVPTAAPPVSTTSLPRLVLRVRTGMFWKAFGLRLLVRLATGSSSLRPGEQMGDVGQDGTDGQEQA